MEPSKQNKYPANRISEWLKEVNEQTLPVTDREPIIGSDSSPSGVHTASSSSPPLTPPPLPPSRNIQSTFSDHPLSSPSIQKRTLYSKHSLFGQSLPPKRLPPHFSRVLSANSKTGSSDGSTICTSMGSANRKPVPLLARSQSAINSVLLIPSKTIVSITSEDSENNSSNEQVEGNKAQSKSSPSSPNRHSLYRSDTSPLALASENDMFSSMLPQRTSTKGTDHVTLPLETKMTHFQLHNSTDIPSGDHSTSQEPVPNTTKSMPKQLYESDLVHLSHLIGDRLPFLTVELGLELSEWDYACKSFKLLDTQALYILRKWYEKSERTVEELCEVLESCAMSECAEWLRKGELKDHTTSNEQWLDKTKPQSQKWSLRSARNKGYSLEEVSTTAATYPEKKKAIQKGFSLQNEDGAVKLVVRQQPVEPVPDSPLPSGVLSGRGLVLLQGRQKPPPKTDHDKQPLRAEIRRLSLSENSLECLKEQLHETLDTKRD